MHFTKTVVSIVRKKSEEREQKGRKEMFKAGWKLKNVEASIFFSLQLNGQS